MLSPDRYFGQDEGFLTQRYIEVCAQLAGLYVQLHDAQVAERKTRHYSFWGSGETTVAARNREADAASLTDWIAVRDIEATIADMQEERDMLVNLLKWQDSHAHI